MSRVLRLGIASALLIALALGTVANATATGRAVLSSSMTGIPTAGLSLLGVPGGGVAWVLDNGTATLSADGRVHVEVNGLVLATTHVNPIATGRVIVACGGAAVDSTAPVPFSTDGHAVVNATVSLPSPCLAPVVFFAGVTGGGDRWFAVTGM